MLLVDVSTPGWEVIWANQEACLVSGADAEGTSLWSLFAMPGVVSCTACFFAAGSPSLSQKPHSDDAAACNPSSVSSLLVIACPW